MSVIYHHTEDIHNLIAPREAVPLVMKLVSPKSVLDVGCGTGTWLQAFAEQGINDYVGVDSEFLDRTLLKIQFEHFVVRDLSKSFSLGRKFDLVLSLEVAEHLSEKYADQFIETLVSHGDTILFSAAIPQQGGQNHLNEQWPSYWDKKFREHGFYFHDSLRPVLWDNKRVDWWYRQNIFIVTRMPPEGTAKARDMVHPELYGKIVRDHQQYLSNLVEGKQGLKIGGRIFANAIIFKVKTWFGLK